MALGAVQPGYQKAYFYPAKTKTGTGGESFDAVSAAFTRDVPDEAGQVFRGGAEAAGYRLSAQGQAAAGLRSGKTVSDAEQETEMDYQKFLQERIEELFIKLQNGETEPAYQIGSQSFTEREWDELLAKFDSVEETIRELMREEHAKREAAQIKKEQRDKAAESSLLAGAFTSCVYPAGDSGKQDVRYITCYTEDGIYCRKEGQTQGWEWMIPFQNREQYDKVMELVEQFSSDWNMRFTSHENFWQDFLKDEIDMDGFMEFMAGTDKGVPDYSVTIGDSMYIDREKVQWAKYMNQDIGEFYTAQEMERRQMELIAANKEKLSKITDWAAYEQDYKKIHPEYNGEKICCQYPGGPLYTVSEIAQLMWKNLLENQNLTGEEYFAQQAMAGRDGISGRCAG